MTDNYLAVTYRVFKGLSSWCSDYQLKLMEQELSEEVLIVRNDRRELARCRNGLRQVLTEIEARQI